MDDRELEALLSVEPSPEFLARVRAAVANEPMASPFRRFVPAFAALAAAAVLVVAAMMSVSRPHMAELTHVSASSASSPAPPSAVRIAEPRPLPAVDRAPPLARVVRRPGTVAVTAVAAEASALPEVIVSPDVARSFQELVASVGARRFEVSPEGMQALLDNTIPEIAPINHFLTDQGAPQ